MNNIELRIIKDKDKKDKKNKKKNNKKKLFKINKKEVIPGPSTIIFIINNID